MQLHFFNFIFCHHNFTVLDKKSSGWPGFSQSLTDVQYQTVHTIFISVRFGQKCVYSICKIIKLNSAFLLAQNHTCQDFACVRTQKIWKRYSLFSNVMARPLNKIFDWWFCLIITTLAGLRYNWWRLSPAEVWKNLFYPKVCSTQKFIFILRTFGFIGII